MYPASWKTQIWSFGLLCKMFSGTVVKILYNQNGHVGCWREMEERDLGQVGISQINIHFPKGNFVQKWVGLRNWNSAVLKIRMWYSWRTPTFSKGHGQANIKQSLTQPNENTLKLQNNQETILVTVWTQIVPPALLLSFHILNWDYWTA